MGITELFILALGLSMDAFAVSICRGLKLGNQVKASHLAEAGIYFGGFQALMPIIGYFIGARFYDLISKYTHWISFILLVGIGVKMLMESFEEEGDEEESNDSMLILGIATSIDALAVGVSLALLKINILAAASFIGLTTFILSGLGIQIGSKFGSYFKSKSEAFGGIILILIGSKILGEHLFF